MKIKIVVIPKSSQNKKVGFYGDELKIKIMKPPVDNEANEEVIKLCKKFFNVLNSQIKIVLGQTSRHKVLEFLVDEIKVKEINKKLENL